MAKADHVVRLGYEETLDIVLPDGQRVSVLLSYQEPGAQLPELDIMLPQDMAANCFSDGLKPAVPQDADTPHVLGNTRQIIIPVEKRPRKKRQPA